MPILAVVGVAVILLLILFLLASPSFRQAMHDTLAGLPILGGWLADNNDRLILYLYGLMVDWSVAAVGSLSGLLNRLADLETAAAGSLVALATAAEESIFHLRYTVVPAAVRQAEDYTDGRLEAARAVLAAAVATARAEAAQFYVGAIRYSQTEYVQAIGYAQAVGLWAAGYAGRAWASAIDYSGQLFSRAELDARAGELRAEAYAAAGTQAAEQYTAGAFAVAVGYAAEWGRTAEGYAEALTGGAIARSDQQNAATLAYATAAAGALALAVQEIERSRCMQRCDTLGQIGEFVEALDVGLLIGLVAWARANPDAAVKATRTELAPALGALGRDVRGLLGR